MPYVYHTSIRSEDVELFTVVCLPEKEGRFPTVLCRSPYVDDTVDKPADVVAAAILESHRPWMEAGYATVSQHCRGTGKSTGDCIPYIHEREDGLALQAWVRTQSFYNGELFLHGGSYCCSVHYVTSPFADDIKGAVLEVQDQNRYNCNYRNGFYKIGLHGSWYVDMYKKKSGLTKSYTHDRFKLLPLSRFSETVFGEKADNFDEILRHPDPDDRFWLTRDGGGETRGVMDNAAIPVLYTTAFYDIYAGGIFDMWRGLSPAARAQSALLVNPYAHSGHPDHQPVRFPGGWVDEQFGHYARHWFDAIRNGTAFPFAQGQVTYYSLFENRWHTDRFEEPTEQLTLPLGDGSYTYRYDPADPAVFAGGLSTCFGGAAWQEPPFRRQDILTVYTAPFEEDTLVKGRMQATLRVRSDAEDTCFYVRVSLAKEEGDLGLRDDIHALSEVAPAYRAGDEVTLHFTFDDHAFQIGKGERLRVDISSSAFPHYVPHTNRRGLFSDITEAAVAENTVLLSASSLTVPIQNPLL